MKSALSLDCYLFKDILPLLYFPLCGIFRNKKKQVSSSKIGSVTGIKETPQHWQGHEDQEEGVFGGTVRK